MKLAAVLSWDLCSRVVCFSNYVRMTRDKLSKAESISRGSRMHPLGVGGGVAPGRDSSLWLSDLKAVTINNRTWEQGRWHRVPDSGDSSSTWKSVIFLSCLPGNTGKCSISAAPFKGNSFFLFFFSPEFWCFSEWELHAMWSSRVPLSCIPSSSCCCASRSSPLWQQGLRWLLATGRFKHFCSLPVFKQFRLLQALPAVTNSEGKGKESFLGLQASDRRALGETRESH